MARMRFKPAEREQFTVGTMIEWQNGGHWHAGEIVGEIYTTGDTWQYLPIIHHGRTTKTVHTGQRVTGTPGKVRLPAAGS